MTVTTRNFGLNNGRSQNMAVTSVSSRVAFLRDNAEDVMIYNTGSEVVYVRTGGDGVSVDTTGIPIAPGEKGIYSKGLGEGKWTHLAAVTAAGTSDLIISQSKGN